MHSEILEKYIVCFKQRWYNLFVQALLLAELSRIEDDGRRKVVEEWSPWLPSYVNPNLSLLAEQGVTAPQPPATPTVQTEEEEEDEEDGILGGGKYQSTFP